MSKLTAGQERALLVLGADPGRRMDWVDQASRGDALEAVVQELLREAGVPDQMVRRAMWRPAASGVRA